MRSYTSGKYTQLEMPYITPNETDYNGIIQAVLLIMWAYGRCRGNIRKTKEIGDPSEHLGDGLHF